MTEAIRYKRFYNKGRGLPEPIWGSRVSNVSEYEVQCPNCGSCDMYLSAHPDDPEEILGFETVRCGNCGSMTDWYEAYKQRINHPTEAPLEVVRT